MELDQLGPRGVQLPQFVLDELGPRGVDLATAVEPEEVGLGVPIAKRRRGFFSFGCTHIDHFQAGRLGRMGVGRTLIFDSSYSPVQFCFCFSAL